MASQPRTWRGTGATSAEPSMASSQSRPMASSPSHGHEPPSAGQRRDDAEPHENDPWARPAAQPGTPMSQLPLEPRSDGVQKHVDYRLDPAPSWGGDMPEKQFKEYHRNLQLWLVEAEARIPTI